MKRIQFDYTNLTADVVGEAGLDASELLAMDVSPLVRALDEFREGDDATYLDLPDQDISAIVERAEADKKEFDDLVVLGIGGSALGARAIYTALTRRMSGRWLDGSERSGVNLHFIDHVDPVAIVDLLETLDLERTCFNVVTKSGSTIETMSSFFLIRELLIEKFGKDGYAKRMVATTDPKAGSLRKLVADEGLTAFAVPPRVGGRFSVLSPVGLYPLAAAGIDIAGLLKGATLARDDAYEASMQDNAAAMFAATQMGLYHKGMPEVVLMPYSQNLVDASAWFVQLWAESLGKIHHGDGGKSFVGPTPIPAIGVTDQHSMLQLLMEGPTTKNVVFVEVEDFPVDRSIPNPRGLSNSLTHLAGKTYSEIQKAELDGVREGLAEQGRPTATIVLPRIDEESLGALLMFFEAATSMAGAILDIDPYNQPGVELGKRYAHGILGREKERHYASRMHDNIENRTKRTITL